MPEISRFLGIVIRMYFADHDPPHFHASYGSDEARVRIVPPEVMDDGLPARALALVLEWATLHQVELLENWRRLRLKQPPNKIPPLE